MNARPQQAKCLGRLSKDESGNALILTAVFLIALLAFAAFSIDMGNVYVQRHLIQSGADAASLAAVQTWATENDVTVVTRIGTTVATNNAMFPQDIVSITPGVWNASNRKFTADSSHNFGNNSVPAVRVIAQRQVPMYFAGIVGIRHMSPRVQSVAIAALATAAAGVMPWAGCVKGSNPQPCQTVTLKNGNDCSGPGNFGTLALGGTGAANYENNIEYGYAGIIRIGDVLDTEPGNKVGPTSALDARLAGAPPYVCDPQNPYAPSQRLAIVITTNDDLGPGRKAIHVTGFWVVALDDRGNRSEVTGKYVQAYPGTEIDPSRPPTTGALSGVALAQ